MLKKFTVLTIMFLFCLALLPGITAADSGDNQAVDNTVDQGNSPVLVQSVEVPKDLSLEDALKLAEENNIVLRQAKLSLVRSKVEADQASLAAKNLDRDLATTLERGKVKYLNEESKKSAYEVSEKAYAVSIEQIKLAVKSHYLDVQKKKDLATVKQESFERAKKQQENAETSFKVGTVAKNDLLSAQMGVAQAKADLTKAESDLRLAEIKLNNDLGLPANTALNLTSTVQYEPFVTVDLAQVVQEAITNHLEIAKCQSTKEMAEENYKVTVQYTAPNTYASQLAKIDAEDASMGLDDAKNKVVSDITSSYLSVLAAEEAVKSYEEAVEQAREAARLTNLRYEVGMATSLEVLNASVQLSDVEANRVNAIYNHYLAKLTFETSKLALTSGS